MLVFPGNGSGRPSDPFGVGCGASAEYGDFLLRPGGSASGPRQEAAWQGPAVPEGWQGRGRRGGG
eukprot:2007198-Rhodomonas_salina.2